MQVVTETQEKQVCNQLACLKKNFEESQNNCQIKREDMNLLLSNRNKAYAKQQQLTFQKVSVY